MKISIAAMSGGSIVRRTNVIDSWLQAVVTAITFKISLLKEFGAKKKEVIDPSL